MKHSSAASRACVARRLTAWGLLSIVCAAGCGPRGTGTVKGRVLLDGEPLECRGQVMGTVVFQNTAGGPKATSSINDAGEYEVRVGSSRQVQPGTYAVSVTSREVLPSEDPNYPPNIKSTIPVKYATSMSSGLKYDVRVGSNTINIELTSR